MTIVEYQFASVPDFISRILHYQNLGWIYRGQADKSWELVPKAGRRDYFDSDWIAKRARDSSLPPQDLGRFAAWREEAIAFSASMPENDFECLAYAQHYGLATRLLDWTTNPLVALYFAAETHHDLDGAVYAYLPWLNVDREHATPDQTFPKVPKFTPRPFDRRIIAQDAVFTVHQQPQIPLSPGIPAPEMMSIAPDGVDLVRFVLVAKLKPAILSHLSVIGIDRKRLFPDLEGLSDFINWETRWPLTSKRSN
jgi:hypothetical protein